MGAEAREATASLPPQIQYLNTLRNNIYTLCETKPFGVGGEWLSLSQETRDFLTGGLAARLKDLPNGQTRRTDQDHRQEIEYLRGVVKERGFDKPASLEIERESTGNPDKLWVISHLEFFYRIGEPNLVYMQLYTIMRSAQLRALGADVNPNMTAEDLHQATINLGPKVLNYLNNRQMIFGDKAVLKLLGEVTADELEIPELGTFKREAGDYPSFERTRKVIGERVKALARQRPEIIAKMLETWINENADTRRVESLLDEKGADKNPQPDQEATLAYIDAEVGKNFGVFHVVKEAIQEIDAKYRQAAQRRQLKPIDGGLKINGWEYVTVDKTEHIPRKYDPQESETIADMIGSYNDDGRIMTVVRADGSICLGLSNKANIDLLEAANYRKNPDLPIGMPLGAIKDPDLRKKYEDFLKSAESGPPPKPPRR